MNYNNLFANSTPITAVGGTFLALLLVWSLIWKGLALWKAARRGDTAWFVLLMILNTVGILEIIYLIFFNKKKKEDKAEK